MTVSWAEKSPNFDILKGSYLQNANTETTKFLLSERQLIQDHGDGILFAICFKSMQT